MLLRQALSDPRDVCYLTYVLEPGIGRVTVERTPGPAPATPASFATHWALAPVTMKKARAVAARRGQSVSALLADELRELVEDDARYAAAKKRAHRGIGRGSGRR